MTTIPASALIEKNPENIFDDAKKKIDELVSNSGLDPEPRGWVDETYMSQAGFYFPDVFCYYAFHCRHKTTQKRVTGDMTQAEFIATVDPTNDGGTFLLRPYISKKEDKELSAIFGTGQLRAFQVEFDLAPIAIDTSDYRRFKAFLDTISRRDYAADRAAGLLGETGDDTGDDDDNDEPEPTPATIPAPAAPDAGLSNVLLLLVNEIRDMKQAVLKPKEPSINHQLLQMILDDKRDRRASEFDLLKAKIQADATRPAPVNPLSGVLATILEQNDIGEIVSAFQSIRNAPQLAADGIKSAVGELIPTDGDDDPLDKIVKGVGNVLAEKLIGLFTGGTSAPAAAVRQPAALPTAQPIKPADELSETLISIVKQDPAIETIDRLVSPFKDKILSSDPDALATVAVSHLPLDIRPPFFHGVGNILDEIKEHWTTGKEGDE